VKQPNPWAASSAVGTLKAAGTITSKQYMLKRLDVYNQPASDAPVPMVAAACRLIVATLGTAAIAFELGPTKARPDL
jgi:hypothetical protein